MNGEHVLSDSQLCAYGLRHRAIIVPARGQRDFDLPVSTIYYPVVIKAVTVNADEHRGLSVMASWLIPVPLTTTLWMMAKMQ